MILKILNLFTKTLLEYDSSSCKNCKILENKVFYLVKIVDKLTKGKSNFESVLSSQSCVFGKLDLGLYRQNKNSESSKLFSTLAEKQSVKNSKQPVVSCFYCMKIGYSVRYCKIRKVLVPRSILKCIPKFH